MDALITHTTPREAERINDRILRAAPGEERIERARLSVETSGPLRAEGTAFT
jgi:hypothetical protein